MSEILQTTEAILIEPVAPYWNDFVAPVAIMTSDIHITTYQTGTNSFPPQLNTTQDDFYSERFALSPVVWIRSSAEDHYSERFALSPVDRSSSSAKDDYGESSTVRDKIDSTKNKQTAEDPLPSEQKLRRSTRIKKEVNYKLDHESEDETDNE